MTLILGLDPGTATTGYGLVDETPGGDLLAIDYGTIQTPASLTDSERLVILHQRVKEIILLHRPQGCAVERLFFQKNVRTAIVVGQARVVILLAGAEAGLSIGEYTPNEVKQAVTGYGNADKQQVQEMVKVLLQLDEIPRPDDAADALAIAITHLHSIHSVYQEQQ